MDTSSVSNKDVDVEDFFITVRAGLLAEAEAAIMAGVNVNTVDDGHATALHYAAANDDQPMVRMLLRYSANPAVRRDYAADTPLLSALRADALAAAAILLEQSLPPDVLQEALWFAARNGSLDVAAMVLAAGVDPDAVTAGGDSALGLARKDPALAKLFRDHGATRDVVFTPTRMVPPPPILDPRLRASDKERLPSSSPEPEAYQWLDQLADPNAAVRTRTAKKLAQLADPETVQSLVAALAAELTDKRTWKTQVELIHALYSCQAPPEVVRYLRHLRDTLDFTDFEIVPITINEYWPD